MSNEFVMVPRETAERAAELLHEYNKCGIARDLRAMLAKQHQGEPVAQVVSRHGDPEAFGEREIEVLADLSKIAYGTKLYTHAYPAEVEQFPHGSPANKAVFMALESYTGATTFEQACIQLAEENRVLRAQLAERDTLLRECYTELLAIKSEIGFRGATLQLIGNIDHQLSAASAEPSAPKCRACNDSGPELIKGVYLTCRARAEPSATVEVDERADALKELEKVAYELKNYNPRADGYKGAYVYGAWASRVRQARAALERKP